MKSLSLRYKPLMGHPLFLTFLGIVSCLLSILYVVSAKHKQRDLQEEILYLNRKHQEQKVKVEQEKELIKRLKRVDPDYIQNTLETLTFLEPETKRLEAFLLDNPTDHTSLGRWKFLKEGANQLKFREKHFQRVGKWQEVEVVQEHPVEMGGEDLKRLLSKIEHVRLDPYTPDPESPNFLIEQFELIRKPLSKDEETFVVKLHCIKREYIHE